MANLMETGSTLRKNRSPLMCLVFPCKRTRLQDEGWEVKFIAAALSKNAKTFVSRGEIHNRI
jgi:hypothetical protein